MGYIRIQPDTSIVSSNIHVQRICEQCGSSFIARTTVTRFCSHRCNSRSHKEKIRKLKLAASTAETEEKLIEPIRALKEKDFLSIQEVCTLLGISRMTLHRQVKSGRVKATSIGRRIIIRRKDIEQSLV